MCVIPRWRFTQRWALPRYGWRYQLFTLAFTAIFALVSFGAQDFISDPCFEDTRGGSVLNDSLMISVVFFTLAWCAGCLLYTRVLLRVRLYSSRFIVIYFVCWTPQIVWFVFEVCLFPISLPPRPRSTFFAAPLLLP